MRPSVASPTGTVIGPPVSITSAAALEAVRRVHRHRAHPVVAEVLLHLADELAGLAVPVAVVHLDRQRRVDLGQLLLGKTASTTTPVTCSTRPTFCRREEFPLLSAISFLQF